VLWGCEMAEEIFPDAVAPGDLLQLDLQLCFPLYAASRLLTRAYQPFLEPLGLTYPQYIVLMILWQDSPCSVSHISERALLNTNTLTPLLKRLELLGYIQRQRCVSDERVVEISLTAAGKQLKSSCSAIPAGLFQATGFAADKALLLKQLLDQLLQSLQHSAE
jgi:DNA-binding MarR family transcriptional regulator